MKLILLIAILIASSLALPTEYNWRKKNPECTLPVQNQGNCGDPLDVDMIILGTEYSCAKGLLKNVSDILSLEYASSCCALVYGAQNCGGCNGGFMNDGLFKFMAGVGTVPSSCYGNQRGCPSTCADGSPIQERYKVSFSPLKTIEDVQQSIMDNAPVMALFDAMPLMFYTGGVMECTEKDNQIDDSCLIVGWGENYWIAEETWGQSFGQKGLFQIRKGQNDCQIESAISAVSVTKE
eukprot:TRINITY_DN1708_c0_g2_i1.p1 TRINITY_DN1708_c0_g2~~TRINITY_DN1708_c0_g2_i1.p1  ORF type:complete len:237 (-),score=52.25 TRINITY_DN1708_c0_g2_i1:36-746(-)